MKDDVFVILEKLSPFDAYLIGSGSFCLYLDLKISDYDIITNAQPGQVISILGTENCSTKFIDFGVIIYKYKNVKYEIATFRKEKNYLDYRHPNEIFFTNNYKEDLIRRDFTINTIMYDKNMNIIDTYNGIKDLNNKIVRIIGDSNQKFSQDPVRILRGLRLVSKYGFEVEPITLKAMGNNKDLISKIPFDLYKSEMIKIFEGNYFCKVFQLYHDIFNLKVFEKSHKNKIFIKNSLILRILLLYEGDLALSREIYPIISNQKKVNLLKNGQKGINSYDFSSKKGIKQAFFDFSLEKCPFEIVSLINDYDFYSSKIDESEYEKRIKLIDEYKDCFNVLHLKINGYDLINFGIKDGIEIKKILKFLLFKVNEEEVLNERNILLNEVEKYFAYKFKI